jgi:hypothetical protein
VHWEVFQSGKSLATGQWVAATGGGLHFLNMPIGKSFNPAGHKGAVKFWWTVGATSYTYSAVRAVNC